jgi:hypothetical protein
MKKYRAVFLLISFRAELKAVALTEYQSTVRRGRRRHLLLGIPVSRLAVLQPRMVWDDAYDTPP